MKVLKYLKPRKYVQFGKAKLIAFNFKVGRSFVTETSALGYIIRFHVSSHKEYYWRAHASYAAEKSTMHWIEHVVKPDDIVYDIGANVGAYSLLLGKIMQSHQGNGRVYAFEPESANFFSLNRNIILNELSDHVIAIPLAFGDQLKLGHFYLSSNVSGSATHGLDEPKSEGIPFQSTHRQGILCMSLDDYVRLENVEFPNHIKIDVDGLEKTIVSNMENVLADRRLTSLIVEIAESVAQGSIEQVVRSKGFKEEYKETVSNDCRVGRVRNILFKRK